MTLFVSFLLRWGRAGLWAGAIAAGCGLAQAQAQRPASSAVQLKMATRMASAPQVPHRAPAASAARPASLHAPASLSASARAVVPASAPAALAPAGAGEQVRVLLVADQETTLSSPAVGRINRLNVTIGAGFAAGQVLIGFECDEPVARLRMAEAELAGAQETLEGKVRMQGLDQAGEVEVALAAAAVAKARGQIELQKAQIAQCTIKAPWAGRVAKVHAKNFMSVTPGMPLVDVVKSGPLRLKLNVPSRLVSHLANGKVFDVAIDETGKSYQARVRGVNSRVDPVSQTVDVEATVTRSHAELLPGMSGLANLGSLR